MNSLSFNWFSLSLFSIFIQFCYMILLLLVLNTSINYLYNQLPQTPHPSIEERDVKIRDLQSLVDDLEAVLERSVMAASAGAITLLAVVYLHHVRQRFPLKEEVLNFVVKVTKNILKKQPKTPVW